MQRTCVLVAAVLLLLATDVRRAQAECSRRYFEFSVKNESAGGGAENLVDVNGQPVGCSIVKEKATASLCSVADDNPQPFQIVVKNDCDHLVFARISIRESHGNNTRIEFKRHESCRGALEAPPGMFQPIRSGDERVVTCTTKAYPRKASPDDSPYVGFYEIEIGRVQNRGMRDVTNGTFDPEIVVERQGGDLTIFEWLILKLKGFLGHLIAFILGVACLWGLAAVRKARAKRLHGTKAASSL